MPLETATHITDLVASNPASSDGLNQADDHMRLIKQVLLNDVGNALTNKNLTTVDGTSSAPSIGFSADATAGLYRKGTGNTAIVGRLTGQGAVPIGTVITFAGSDAGIPAGYLPCDGQAVSRTTYSELWFAIGTIWGAGDGSTTFNVPNLQDRFPRHRSGSAAGPVGTLQADQNKSHTHVVAGNTGLAGADHTHPFSVSGTVSVSGSTSAVAQGSLYTPGLAAGGNPVGAFVAGSYSSAAASVSASGSFSYSGNTGTQSANHGHAISLTSGTGSADGTEARPLSATLLFCIRAL